MANHIITELENIASNKAAEKGFEVLCVQLLAHLKPMTIQIQIRHQLNKKGVSISDCACLTSPLQEAITKSELINKPYVLEVTSPGIGEFLINEIDFKTFKGFPVEVIYQSKDKNKLNTNGLLHERSKEHLRINMKGKISNIPRDDVINVRLTTPSG